jgi:1,4-dihydroxy-2-naphthoyl-CoA hydrolase
MTTPSTPDSREAATQRLFVRPATLADLDRLHRETAVHALGIEFLEIGAAHLRARMPVDARTRQPMGILHGGASVTLAETLGSVAAVLCLPEGRLAVGLEINANHIRAARSGWVTGLCTPVHVGRSTHVWQIEIRDDAERLVCTSRITMAILDAEPGAGPAHAKR